MRRFQKIIQNLLGCLPVALLWLVRVPRHHPHSIRDVGSCLVGDPHQAPHHLSERHSSCPLILHQGPVIVGKGSRDRACATNIKSLENTPDVIFLRNLNRASLAVANKCATKKELDLTQILRRKSCLLYTSPSPRDGLLSRMPSSA